MSKVSETRTCPGCSSTAECAVPRRVPEKPGPKQMDEIARQHAVGISERNVGIRQVGAKQSVVFLDARAQQQRPAAVEPQPEARQVPGVFVIQPLLSGAERANVARVVEDRKGVVVFEDRGPLGRFRSGREDIELVLNLDDVFHVTPAIGRRRRSARSLPSLACTPRGNDWPRDQKLRSTDIRQLIGATHGDAIRSAISAVRADPAVDPVADDLFDRAAGECQHRRAAGHRLDHHQAERLLPLNGEQ